MVAVTSSSNGASSTSDSQQQNQLPPPSTSNGKRSNENPEDDDSPAVKRSRTEENGQSNGNEGKPIKEEDGQNTAKRKKESFPCLSCCITYTTAGQLEAHLVGKRHRKTLCFQSRNGKDAAENTNDDGFLLSGGRSCCKICNLTMTGVRQLKQHLNGRGHKNQKRRIKKIKKEGNASGFEVFEPKVDIFYCNECKANITGDMQYVDHVNGKRHKKALKLMMSKKQL